MPLVVLGFLPLVKAMMPSVSVCGELAGDPVLTAVLLTLGVRRFSVSRPDYDRVVDLMERVSIADLEEHRNQVLRARTGGEVRQILAALPPVPERP